MKGIVLFVLMIISTLISAQEEIEGYGNWKWGTLYTDVQDELVPSTNKIPGFKAYEKKNETLEFEGLKARLISYAFKNGEFVGINIGLFSEDLEKIVEIFTGKYGEPLKTETPFLTNYEWHINSADISITNLPSSGNEGLAVGIKRKK
ncbi:MAG: hypothetical protein JXB17_11400 [Bacteroidales bacterium]|nr:hypothetical protein [Bacteroidales bacterium]